VWVVEGEDQRALVELEVDALVADVEVDTSVVEGED
jgi:hypothetical protein